MKNHHIRNNHRRYVDPAERREEKSNIPSPHPPALTSIVAVSHLHRPQTHCPRPEQISNDPGLENILIHTLERHGFSSLVLFALLNFGFHCW